MPRPPKLFRNRRFEPSIIVTCVRWYFRFSLSLRDLEELMAERGLSVDHTTIWRWTQAYGPEVHRQLSGNIKRKSSTWHVDETFVRIAGQCLTLESPAQPRSFCIVHYLYKVMGFEPAAEIQLGIRYGGLRGRILASATGQRRLVMERKNIYEDELAIPPITFALANVESEIVEIVKKLCAPLFMIFDFQEFGHNVYEQIVTNFVQGRVT